MSNNDPRHEEDMDNFRRALTQHTGVGTPEIESSWDRIKATLGEVAERSTGWAAARVHDALSDFVGRVLYGETTSPEPSDRHLERAREIAEEHEKGVER
jgi:hypothetical protein